MPSPPIPLDDEGAYAVIDSMAPLLGLAIEPAWRTTVAMNVKTVATAAGLVLAFPLEDEAEPAPVFRA